MSNEKKFLSPDELVERWASAITKRTLANWRVQKKGPAWRKFGGRVLYSIDDVEAYEKAQGIAPEPGPDDSGS